MGAASCSPMGALQGATRCCLASTAGLLVRPSECVLQVIIATLHLRTPRRRRWMPLQHAGANKHRGPAVLVSRHSLLGQFASLKATMDAAGSGAAASSGGQHGMQGCRDNSSKIVQDFDARYRAIKAQYASTYMAAWSRLLRTAAFALWLCGSTLPKHEQLSKHVAM